MVSSWGRNLSSSLPWDPDLTRPSGMTALGTAMGLTPQAATRVEVGEWPYSSSLAHCA